MSARLDKSNATTHLWINAHNLSVKGRHALLGKGQEQLTVSTTMRCHDGADVATATTDVSDASRGLETSRIDQLSL